MGDALDRDQVIAAVAEARPDAIVHQLTAIPKRIANPRKLGEAFGPTNLLRREGTRNLVDAAGGRGLAADLRTLGSELDGYVPSMQERLDPRAPAGKGAVVFDHREVRSGIPDALAAAGIELKPEQLPAGDYVLSDRLVVERKTGADLAASIKDRRLFEQIGRLKASFDAVVLVVEGEPVHISEASWQGALARALASGASLLRTADSDETAIWLARFHRLEGKPPTEVRGRPLPRRPTGDLGDVAEDVLRCLPGISSVGARRLLEHFGSLHAVFNADERALRAVPGIGPIRSGALFRLFTEYVAR
jgi:ERCC4-type nuclease